MTNAEKVNKLLLAYEVLLTASEAVEMLLKGEGHPGLKGDVAEGLKCVSEATEPILVTVSKEGTKKLRQLLQKVNGALEQPAVLSNLYQKFHMDYLTLAYQYLVNNLQAIGGGDAQLMQAIFAFLDKTPDDIAVSKSAVMWLTAVVSAASLPLESYRYGMLAFTLNPELGHTFNLDRPAYQPHPVITTEKCPMCGAAGVPHYAAHQFLASNYVPLFPPVKLWMRCPDCDVLYAYQFPKLVQDEFIGCDTTEDAEQITPRYPLRVSCNILNQIRQYTDGIELLEVGIGNGELIATAAEMGFSVEGVEIAVKEAHKVQTQLGFQIHCCDFLQFETDKRYDVITMGDVLEHVFEPAYALKKAASLLKSNGVLWLSTPNRNSAFSRYRKFEDPMWKEPWHFTYFSLENLIPYLKKQGFQLLRYDVSERYNGSMELCLRKL